MLAYKVISGVAAMALGAAVVLAMPGFSPDADAGPAPSIKGDRLDIHTAKDCSQQTWPYYDAGCLHDGKRIVGNARPVRVVTTDRVTTQ
jgi:hypothetical protein